MEAVRVPVRGGMFALVDAGDSAAVLAHKWHPQRRHDGGAVYAQTSLFAGGLERPISLHRFILQPPPGMVVDHISGDGLDNRRANLRICTQHQNAHNTYRPRGRSRFKGVTWHKQMQKWQAEICIRGKHIYLGLFSDEVEAARVRDAFALAELGSFARLNFPLRQSA